MKTSGRGLYYPGNFPGETEENNEKISVSVAGLRAQT
jgi:hypothetical protein